jgi:hypothetical protein
MPQPRVILWDIETTHNLVAVFTLKNQDWINAENILQERYVVCAAWKVLGEKTIHAVSTLNDAKRFAKNPHDDMHVLQTLHKVLSGADIIVAHNGDQYDIKFTEARMLIQGLPPLPPLVKVDTLTAARSRFLFNANNLDYLGQMLGLGRKKPTPRGLWLKVLNGDKAAIRTMVAYNKGDVSLLEKVYLRLRPYMPNHTNRELFGQEGCPRCGSAEVQRRGFHRSTTLMYQKFVCVACGGWFRSKASIKPNTVRHRIL